MKRNFQGADVSGGGNRRQPQISCDFCRRKKLKCDRGEPCTNCVSRKLTCSGQPAAKVSRLVNPHREVDNPIIPSASDQDHSSILARLRKIEQVVFGDGEYREENPMVSADSYTPNSLRTEPFPSRRCSPRPPVDTDNQNKARRLDLTFTEHAHEIHFKRGTIEYQVDDVSSKGGRCASNNTDGPGGTAIGLMTREEALIFLHSFTHRPLHILPIPIHENTVQSMILQFYNDLASPGSTSPNHAHAALILSIAATCASFYQQGCRLSAMFDGTKGANECTIRWLQSALQLLDESKWTGTYCLEDIQARVILSYVIYNIEGCSSRYRILHTGSVCIARDLGLHLVDSPRSIQQGDNRTAKEIKRRIWWYITSTDWMLGFMGAPLNGTYLIQLRHMNVRLPRNIHDDEIDTKDDDFSHPDHVLTGMSSLIQRTKLANACRLAIDARAAGTPDDDLLDIERAKEIDGVFQSILEELPSFFRPCAPIPSDAPDSLELQRNTILLAIHSRRARLHRGYLLSSNTDPEAVQLRKACLDSARIAISVATQMLNPSQPLLNTATSIHSTSTIRKMGVVVGHLFMGCTMLALRSDMVLRESGETECISVIHEELEKACRALTLAAENSPIANALLRSLKTAYKQNGPPNLPVPNLVDVYYESKIADEGDGRQSRSLLEGEGEDGRLMTEPEPVPDLLWPDFLNMVSETEPWEDIFASIDPLIPS